ncbi:MAG: hypothetical protein E7812_12980 [Phenylobacterium sp.]|nr:MAG: hypothetical protein E7812_12980 [Phenylobacterium sp.]
MLLLLLNHAPGAYAHLVARGTLLGDDVTSIGVGFAALGALSFVVGVAIAHVVIRPAPVRDFVDRPRFEVFCLLGGWLLIYGLTPLRSIPSLGAAIEKGGDIWILGVLLALRFNVRQNAWRRAVPWVLALGVFPVMMLLLGGFLSYGATAIIIACSVLAVSTQSNGRVIVGSIIAVFVGMTLFVNYYSNRDAMRTVVWSQSTISQRIDANMGMFTNFRLFNQADPAQLDALDQRLNQNVFIGIAQKRLDGGQVHYLGGRSVSDAILSLVPRVIWPNKPISGGSPALIAEMTGLRLNQDTSFGVGQVMEFQINFGPVGVVIGFILLGWLIAYFDIKAALAESRGDLSRTLLFFLPGVALLQPIGSLVELSGGAASALIAALAWRWLWVHVISRTTRPGRLPGVRRPLRQAAR